MTKQSQLNNFANQSNRSMVFHFEIVLSVNNNLAGDKVCQLPAKDLWFSPFTPASSTSKTGRLDMTEILLKMALNPNQTKK